MNNKILATVAFGFLTILAGCSGAAPEGSELQSSELKAPGKGDPGKGDPGKDVPTPPDSSKDTPPVPEKSEPSDTPPPDKGEPKEPPSDASCFVIVEKSACQSDDAWKNIAAKICDQKGLSLTSLSTSDDCKGGSTIAKIECCKNAQ